MKQKLINFFALTIIFGILTIVSFGQELRATSFELKNKGFIYGELWVTVNGKQKNTTNSASDAWIINDGKEVVFVGSDGAGGFENEGQSLNIYEVQTGKSRKLMAQYYMIMGLSEFKLKNGQIALLVRMEDGGLGASYFSVVDPKRGEVFFRSEAEIISLKNDTIRLLFYDDWENISLARNNDAHYEHKNSFPLEKAKAKVIKSETHDLNKILKNKVIKRKHTMEYLDAGLKYVKIYLWRSNEDSGSKPFVLGTVDRQVNSAAPLRPTLEELFLGSNKDEAEKGFSSSTFGMKFEGVVFKNGVATVKFSQPKDQTNHGSLAPSIFLEAIEKTAKQFPAVKKVEVCAIGDTLIDAQLEKQFPRCR